MEVFSSLFLLFILKICDSSSTNDHAAAGEIWTNQTDIEVVNGTDIQNMLHKCEGCIVNIKTIPSSDYVSQQNDDNTVQKDVLTTEQVTSNGTGKESPSLQAQQDITIEHAAELSDMLKRCPGCYVDYQLKEEMNSNNVTLKEKERKQKKKRKKGKKDKKRNKKKKQRIANEQIIFVANSVRWQPPEREVTSENKDASEKLLNELPLSESASQSNPAESNLTVVNIDAFLSNSSIDTPKNPTDEQLGNIQQLNDTYGQSLADAMRPHLENTSRYDNASSNPPDEDGTTRNASDGDIRTSSDMLKVEPGGPITIEVEHHQTDDDLVDYVSPKELKKLLRKEDVRLIDLRETWEINNSGKIKNSVHIALNSLGLALKLTENKFKMKYGINKPETDDCNIVFMDSSGERSDIAYKYAREHGYQCPRSLHGGFNLWRSMLGNDESTYDDTPKANVTRIDTDGNPNNPRPQYEMKKKKKTFISHR